MRSIFLCLVLIFVTAGSALAQSEGYAVQFEKYSLLLKSEKSADKIARLRYNIGVCLYQLDRAPEAIIEFEKAVALRGDYQKAFYAMGMAHAAAGNIWEAKNAFHSAASLNEKDGEAWFDLAMIFLSEKNYDEALAAFAKSIANKSVNTMEAHNNTGVILAIKGDWLAAEKRFELAAGSAEGFSNLMLCRLYRNGPPQELIAKLRITKGEKSG